MRATTTSTEHHVGFGALIEKVKQAEAALEAREREAADDWDRLKATWRATWTPWRIVAAGLVGGFVVGKAEPLKKTTGGGALQLLSALAGLFAGGSAQVAAGEAEHAAGQAEHAAHTAEQTAEAVAPGSVPHRAPSSESADA